MLKGSFDKRVRLDLPVPLPAPTPSPQPPHPLPLFPHSPPITHLNPTPNASPRDANRNSHPFVKATPGKSLPLSFCPKLRSFYLCFVFSAYGGGTVHKKTKPNFRTAGAVSRKTKLIFHCTQRRPNRMSTVSKKDQANAQQETKTNRRSKKLTSSKKIYPSECVTP